MLPSKKQDFRFLPCDENTLQKTVLYIDIFSCMYGDPPYGGLRLPRKGGSTIQAAVI